MRLDSLALVKTTEHAPMPSAAKDKKHMPPKWQKAERLELGEAATTDSVVGEILGACWTHAAANTAAALDGRDPEGVHQMRVGLRRLRSALSLFKGVVAHEQTNWVRAEAKWMLSWLGPARDWDVFLTEKLHSVRLSFPDDPNLALVERSARRRRTRAYQVLRSRIASDRFTAFSERFPDWHKARGWQHPDGEDLPKIPRKAHKLARKLLTRRHKKALRMGQDLSTLAAEDRHQLRIELKKVRYACEFFRSLYDDRTTARYLTALKRLQDDFGHLNDIAVAKRLLDDLSAASKSADTRQKLSVGRGIMIGWSGKTLADSEPALLEDWSRFTDLRPFW